MPEEAIEVVTSTYAAWNAGDLGLEHFDPEVKWELLGKMALDQADTVRGRDALLDYWRRFWGAWKPGAPRCVVAFGCSLATTHSASDVKAAANVARSPRLTAAW